MRIVILEDAEADLDEGFEFYEQQNAGLGEYFLHALAADIEALRFYAGVHRMSEGFYRCPAKRFPYIIYYPVADEVVSIEAVIDNRRDPDFIRQRLQDL